MPPRSTAYHLSYDLRPAKQSERRIILDLLKIGGDIGFDISGYRYLGMGANRFYDFLLVHRYIGIRDMISLEHDPKMFKRASFNNPYDFIKVIQSSVDQFLQIDPYTRPTVAWLDYDGGLSTRLTQDISSLANKTKPGDFSFVTVYGGPPRRLERESDESRLAWLNESFGAYAGKVKIEDVEDDLFPGAVHKIILATFRNAYTTRTDGVFLPFFQIRYSDSVPMITVGGGFMAEGSAVQFRSRMKDLVPFLQADGEYLYSIKSLHLTERERALFDQAVTKKKRRSIERNKLKTLGFGENDLRAYMDLLRYLPRYVETLV